MEADAGGTAAPLPTSGDDVGVVAGSVAEPTDVQADAVAAAPAGGVVAEAGPSDADDMREAAEPSTSRTAALHEAASDGVAAEQPKEEEPIADASAQPAGTTLTTAASPRGDASVVAASPRGDSSAAVASPRGDASAAAASPRGDNAAAASPTADASPAAVGSTGDALTGTAASPRDRATEDASGVAEGATSNEAAQESPADDRQDAFLDSSRDLATTGDPALHVQHLDVADTNLDVLAGQTDGQDNEMAKATATQLQAAVENVIAQFGSGLANLPQGDMRSALADWAARFQGHVTELQGIVENNGSRPPTSQVATQILPLLQEETLVDPGLDDAASTLVADAEELVTDMEGVRSMRQELESVRTGRDVEELASAWADPEETAKEVAELRRVRRQIRYIFGGMISELPESSTLRVDDLLNDHSDAEQARAVASNPFAAVPAPVKNLDTPAHGAPSAASEVQQAEPTSYSKSPPLPPKKQGGSNHGRPPSGGTEMSYVTNSSVVSLDSQATGGEDHGKHRDRDRKERKHRRHHRHRDERSDVDDGRSRERKKDDGSIPKQWNWAEEVVKASLDPQNQWEFPNRGRGDSPRGERAPGQQPSWEQPRQRGADIASKARERAEAVDRQERDRNRYNRHHYDAG